MAITNRIIKYHLNDRNIYEAQSSDIIYDIIFGDKADEYISSLVKDPIIKIDVTGNTVRFYVDSDLISTMKYYKGVVLYTGLKRKQRIRVVPAFLDLAIKKELYDLVREYNISDKNQIGLLVNGQVVKDIENYIYWPIELNTKIYDSSRINISREGQIIIDLIKVATTCYSRYVADENQLSEETAYLLKDSGLYDTFQDFLKQYN